VEQGGHSPSFQQASQQLKRLLNVDIGTKETQRLTEHTGRQWIKARDEQVEQFKQGTLARLHAQAPQATVVMVDGGRSQVRADDAGPGVHDPGWREVKYASLATLASRAVALDPQPEPPSKLLNPERVKKIVEQMHDQHVPVRKQAAAKTVAPARKRRRANVNKRITRLLTTFVASMQNSEQFGYMVAAEASTKSTFAAGALCPFSIFCIYWAISTRRRTPWKTITGGRLGSVTNNGCVGPGAASGRSCWLPCNPPAPQWVCRLKTPQSRIGVR